MVEHGSAAAILNEWRAVERELEDPELGPAAREILQSRAATLRDKYQALSDPRETEHDRATAEGYLS